ncbi:MAG TPA: MlaD family protein [Kofleriaceae bacterium]|nr:MlaD family protein [Kofleriaceae bacterium]
MQQERRLELRVGLLVLVAVAVFIGFVVVLGNFSLRSGFTVYADFDYVGNLQAGAPIKVSGIKVGKVRELSFRGGAMDPQVQRRVQVRVEAWLEDRARESIRADAELFINTAGVLGEQYLEIVPGKDFERPAVVPGAILRGTDPPRTDLVVARLYEVLDGVSSVLRDDRQAIADVLRNGASAVAEVNRLLVDNRQELSGLITGGAALAREATETLRGVNGQLKDGRLANLVGHADALLVTADGSLRQLTPPASELLGEARRAAGLVTEARLERALTVADKAATAAASAGGLVDNVNGLVTDLRQGKGSAGALLSRDDLYADLRELITDLKRHPWKLFWKE